MAISIRDREYIESRLISPCSDVVDAHGRLLDVGEVEAARELMKAMQEFTDKCRAIRYDFIRKSHAV